MVQEKDANGNNVGASPGTNPDWDRDGDQDSPTDSVVAANYRNGIATLLMKLPQLRPNLLMAGNADGTPTAGHLRDPEYQGLLSGALTESAMGLDWSVETWGHWSGMMAEYRAQMDNTADPHLVFLQAKGLVNGDPQIQPATHPFVTGNQSFMRYSYASAALEDGYFTYGKTDGYQTPGGYWFPEFDVVLGHPLEGRQLNPWNGTVYRRRFQNGTVWVNQRETSTGAAGTPLTYTIPASEGSFRTVAGTNVTSFTLQPGDGLVLLLNQN